MPFSSISILILTLWAISFVFLFLPILHIWWKGTKACLNPPSHLLFLFMDWLVWTLRSIGRLFSWLQQHLCLTWSRRRARSGFSVFMRSESWSLIPEGRSALISSESPASSNNLPCQLKFSILEFQRYRWVKSKVYGKCEGWKRKCRCFFWCLAPLPFRAPTVCQL